MFLLLFGLSFLLIVYMIWHLSNIILSIIFLKKKHTHLNLEQNPRQQIASERIAILYPTCNDFNEKACSSILNQENISFDIYILDDSTELYEIKKIDDWVNEKQKIIKIIRRQNKIGFKSGNINNWLNEYGDPLKYPYILIVDADEFLPKDFVKRLLIQLKKNNFVFAQACHVGTAMLNTLFQKLLHPQVECEWFYQVPARNLGIPTVLGHGVLIHTKSLIEVDGFPNYVSEDLALTILLAQKNLTGIITPSVIGMEEFPQNYYAYWKRRRKWIQADAEVIRKVLTRLWQNRIKWLARLDLAIRELRLAVGSTYWLLLLLMSIMSLINIEIKLETSPLQWLSLFLILSPIIPSILIKRLNIFQKIGFISTMTFIGAATTSLHPIASIHGFLGEQYFDPTGNKYNTPKTTLSRYYIWEIASSLIFVLGGIISFNLPLIAIGFAIGCSPLLRSNHQNLILLIGTILFWMLIFYQISYDIKNGSVPIEHLFALIGLSITLI